MASSRGRQAIRHERQPLPFWVGLVSGFVLGIVISSIFIYRDYNLERRRAAEEQQARQSPAMTAPPRTPTTLPSVLTEPVAPANQPRPPIDTPAPAPAPIAQAPASPPAAPAAATSSGRSLVAGSLKSRAEAEQRKAELALLGVSSRVVETRVNGEQRFRVTIGPFRSDAELEQTRAQLRGNGVDSFPTQ